MPSTSPSRQEAVDQILEAVMFENWLRFYFLRDLQDAASDEDEERPVAVLLSDEERQTLAAREPALFPLALMVEGREAGFATSRDAVCRYLLEELDGRRLPQGMAAGLLESPLFQAHLQLFNNWLQEHETVLDRTYHDFADWRVKFAQWRTRPDLLQQVDDALRPATAAQAAGATPDAASPVRVNGLTAQDVQGDLER